MERLSNLIKTGELAEKARDQLAQVCYAVLLTDVVAVNTGIVLTPGHMRTAETSFKTATQVIQNKLQESEM